MFSYLLSAGLAAAMPPVEFVVDCSTAQTAVRVETKFIFQCETRDGRKAEAEITISPEPSPKAMLLTFESVLEDWGCRFERLGDTAIVVRGSKTSPIKSVTFKGDGYVPLVTRRLATVPPPNPPKKP